MLPRNLRAPYWRLHAAAKGLRRAALAIPRALTGARGTDAADFDIGTLISLRQRYARMMRENRDLFDPAVSVLEWDADTGGITPFLARDVTSRAGSLAGVADQGFDIVICADRLHLLAKADRLRALADLLRIARHKLLITCPSGPMAEEAQAHLAETLAGMGRSIPDWLHSNLERGFPPIASLLADLAGAGHVFTISVNESLNQYLAGHLLERLLPFAAKLNGRQATKVAFEPAVGPAYFDYAHSYLITVDLQARPAPAELLQREAAAGAAPVQLYSVYHRPWEMGHLGKITPIFSGSAADQAPEGALTDITRTVPRLQNTRWSELSAYFRVWQEGPQSAIIGFSHYRRLFDFGTDTAGHARPDQRETTITTDELPGHAHRLYDAALIEALDDNTILLPPPIELAETVWEHYHRRHTIGDYCRVVGRLSVKYPHLLVELPAQFEENLLYANNMFIMRWQLFDEICGIWFDLLGEMAAELPNNRANDYQNRDVSFMAERIFDLWIRHKRREGLRLIETPILFIEPPKA